MKKALLALFILFDIALIGGSVFVLKSFLQGKMPSGAGRDRSGPPAASAPSLPSVSTSAVSAAGAPTQTPPEPENSTTRKIKFAYHNSRARKVAIRADFTGWKAEPMVKEANGVWTYNVALTPGEYAYCFSVDDKIPLKDPANKRTKVIGKAVVSAIVVQALPAKPPK